MSVSHWNGFFEWNDSNCSSVAPFQPEAHFHPAFPVSTECNRSEQAASLEPVERSRDYFQTKGFISCFPSNPLGFKGPVTQ